MNDRPLPDELTRYQGELARAQRRAERIIDPGSTALTVSIAVLLLLGSLMLPWTGEVRGWEVLAGTADLGPFMRFFALEAVIVGVGGSALALATRWWGLAALCAVGSGFAVVAGMWAIWSRQIGIPDGGTAAGPGLVLAALVMLVLAGSWVRIALRRE